MRERYRASVASDVSGPPTVSSNAASFRRQAAASSAVSAALGERKPSRS